MDARSQVSQIYANQGLHANAIFIASLHGNAIDYLRQAPVLALAFGAKFNTRADRLYTATRIGGPIERGERLRNVLAAAGVAYPLRKLSGSILAPKYQPLVRQLGNIRPSTLSQSIPDMAGQQRSWLRALMLHNARCTLRGRIASPEEFQWFVMHSGESLQPEEAGDIVDYIHAEGEFDWSRWSWSKARTECELWHDRSASQTALLNIGGGICAETVIDFTSYPEHFDHEGIECFKLTTPAMLFEEGRRMRHCVASYVRDVLDGRCSIVSLRREMRRIATAQIVNGRCVQLKGFANRHPPAGTRAAIKAFIESAA